MFQNKCDLSGEVIIQVRSLFRYPTGIVRVSVLHALDLARGRGSVRGGRCGSDPV